MVDLAVLTAFFGWCTVINSAMLLFATLSLSLFRPTVKRIHHSMMGVPQVDLDGIYFKYLAYYKIAILIFNLVPYLALLIVA